MNNREQTIKAFLAENDMGTATLTPLAGDASFRSYRRIKADEATFILMDAPPGKEDAQPFVALSNHLVGAGFSAPRVLAQDLEQGLLLLEDLGDDTFSRVLETETVPKQELYEAAIDVLAALHDTAPPKGLPVYGLDLLFEELFLFPRWYLPALLGMEDPAWEKELAVICTPLFGGLQADTNVLTLRDYHADNLMWLPDRGGIQNVGLLDFQDGVVGHRAYDLVSLLQDARQPFDPDLESAMIDRYLSKAGVNIDRAGFMTAYQVLGAQRNAKIIGIFTRLWRRDGKPAYPKMIPHVWGLLEENLRHPALGDLKTWMEAIVPTDFRTKTLT